MKDDDITRVFNAVDRDRSGAVDASEFNAWVGRQSLSDSSPGYFPEVIRTFVRHSTECVQKLGWYHLFDTYDGDKSGGLGPEEFINAVRSECGVGPGDLSDDELKELFRMIDEDGSEAISAKEFYDCVKEGASSTAKMTYYCFKQSLFELADVWSLEVSEASYMAFLTTVYDGISFAGIAKHKGNDLVRAFDSIQTMLQANGTFRKEIRNQLKDLKDQTVKELEEAEAKEAKKLAKAEAKVKAEAKTAKKAKADAKRGMDAEAEPTSDTVEAAAAVTPRQSAIGSSTVDPVAAGGFGDLLPFHSKGGTTSDQDGEDDDDPSAGGYGVEGHDDRGRGGAGGKAFDWLRRGTGGLPEHQHRSRFSWLEVGDGPFLQRGGGMNAHEVLKVPSQALLPAPPSTPPPVRPGMGGFGGRSDKTLFARPKPGQSGKLQLGATRRRAEADVDMVALRRFKWIVSSLGWYKRANRGSMDVPALFMMDAEDCAAAGLPEHVKHFRLGHTVKRIRDQGAHVSGRPDNWRVLDDMGFLWGEAIAAQHRFDTVVVPAVGWFKRANKGSMDVPAHFVMDAADCAAAGLPEHVNQFRLGYTVKKIRDAGAYVSGRPDNLNQLDAMGVLWGEEKGFSETVSRRRLPELEPVPPSRGGGGGGGGADSMLGGGVTAGLGGQARWDRDHRMVHSLDGGPRMTGGYGFARGGGGLDAVHSERSIGSSMQSESSLRLSTYTSRAAGYYSHRLHSLPPMAKAATIRRLKSIGPVTTRSNRGTEAMGRRPARSLRGLAGQMY